jgi:hypothetical protein
MKNKLINAISILVLVTPAWSGAAPAWNGPVSTAAGRDGRHEAPIRVGVYNGDGASPGCVIETYEALRMDGGIVPSLIGPTDIYSGKLSGLDVIIFPGGSGSTQYNSLGSVSCDLVRRFVLDEGKGVVGICAGGYLVSDSKGYPCLHLIGADTMDREHDKRGSALVEVSFTEKGLEFFPEMKEYSRGYIQYHDGPVFVPPAGEDAPLYDELAVNNSDVHHDGGAPSGITTGKSFLLRQEAGKGRVFACAGHPEATTGMRWMVPRMARWVARRESVRYPANVTRPWLGKSEIMHSDETETLLFWKLFDDDPKARIGALEALRANRYRSGFRWAAGMIRDSSPEVRAFAGGVLAEAEYTAAIPDLEAVIMRETDSLCRDSLQSSISELKGMIAPR